ncbi:MAG: hypothetical protein LBP22_13765 [Deltaproteobacteria bacterium]|nr:hypothetical protein [Deltaproteobacteria bacterium]
MKCGPPSKLWKKLPGWDEIDGLNRTEQADFHERLAEQAGRFPEIQEIQEIQRILDTSLKIRPMSMPTANMGDTQPEKEA